MKIRNKYRIWAYRWGLIFSGIGLFLILLPSMADINMMNGGFALQFGGFFMLITAIISVFVLNKNAKLYDKLANFDNIIARWTLDAKSFAIYANYDKIERINKHKAMFWIISVISIFVGILLVLLGLEISIILQIIIGIIVFIWIVSRLAILATTRRSSKQKGEIIIAKEGGIINGELHNWSQLEAILTNVKITSIEEGLEVLEVYYSTLQRTGEVRYTARFPIPKGKLEEARMVEQTLME